MKPGLDAASAEVVVKLADRFGLDFLTLAESPVLPRVLPELLAAMSADAIVEAVARRGGLANVYDPYAVIVSRCRKVLVQLDARVALRAEEAARRRALQIEAAKRRGRLLAGLVLNDDETLPNARKTLEQEFPDADMLEIALDAFEAVLG